MDSGDFNARGVGLLARGSSYPLPLPGPRIPGKPVDLGGLVPTHSGASARDFHPLPVDPREESAKKAKIEAEIVEPPGRPVNREGSDPCRGRPRAGAKRRPDGRPG